MVQKIHPRAGQLSEKNDDLAVQYENVHGLEYLLLYCFYTWDIVYPERVCSNFLKGGIELSSSCNSRNENWNGTPKDDEQSPKSFVWKL